MNKKVFLIPLLALSASLCSCKGLYTSVENGRKILDHIIDKFTSGGVTYEKFTYTITSKTETGYLTYNSVYNKTEKYYHYYRVDNAGVYEYWRYAKNDKEGAYSLYLAERVNGAVDEKGNPLVKLQISSYKDDKWQECVLEAETTINVQFKYALDNADKCISHKAAVNDKAIKISSLNNESVCIEGTIDETYHSYIFDNGKLTSFETSDKTNSIKFNCDYRAAQINYLSE